MAGSPFLKSPLFSQALKETINSQLLKAVEERDNVGKERGREETEIGKDEER